MSTFTAMRVRMLLLLVSALLLLLLAAGCVRNTGNETGNKEAPSASRPPPAPLSTAQSENVQPSTANAPLTFVGDAACATCHPSEFKDQKATHHAVTLRLADRTSLGKLAPNPTVLPGSKARIEQIGDRYRVGLPSGRFGPIQYALGSGKSGITFVTLMGSHTFEMRATYFPRQRKWKVTPGQSNAPSTAMGVDHKDEDARRCLACHTTTLPPDSNVPEKPFFGVGCEACHGAGSAHVVAMQTGKSANTAMERIGTWDATRVNELCGKCHRTASEGGIPPDSAPDLSVTSRFQPYALMLSRCFKASGNTLSCITCHNPHQNTSHDRPAYEAICLNCHGGKAQQRQGDRETGRQGDREKKKTEENAIVNSQSSIHNRSRLASSASPGKRCPVNPRAGCIGCHMPYKPMLPGEMITTPAPDHFIRVRRPAQEAQWARAVKKMKSVDPLTAPDQ